MLLFIHFKTRTFDCVGWDVEWVSLESLSRPQTVLSGSTLLLGRSRCTDSPRNLSRFVRQTLLWMWITIPQFTPCLYSEFRILSVLQPLSTLLGALEALAPNSSLLHSLWYTSSFICNSWQLGRLQSTWSFLEEVIMKIEVPAYLLAFVHRFPESIKSYLNNASLYILVLRLSLRKIVRIS